MRGEAGGYRAVRAPDSPVPHRIRPPRRCRRRCAMSLFSSTDESAHYGFSVCMLLQRYRDPLRWAEEGVVELGTGDASAIAEVVRHLPGLRVRGFYISA